MNIEEKIKQRTSCNFLLEYVVSLYRSLFPDLRYIQILWILGIIDKGCDQTMATRFNSEVIDRFSEEPYDTIVRILPNIVDLINNKFPEEAYLSDKLTRITIITSLEELGLAKKTDDLKLEICS